jgi:hypothetical protein
VLHHVREPNRVVAELLRRAKQCLFRTRTTSAAARVICV